MSPTVEDDDSRFGFWVDDFVICQDAIDDGLHLVIIGVLDRLVNFLAVITGTATAGEVRLEETVKLEIL